VEPFAACRPGADDRLPEQGFERAVAERGFPAQLRERRLQRSGISASTEMRARTSSPRFVSWVERVVSDAGKLAWRSCWRRWNSVTPIENSLGSAPTSVSDPRRV